MKLTLLEWLRIIEEILRIIRKHQAPLRAIRDLHAAQTRNTKMSMIVLKWTDPVLTVRGKPGVTASVDIFQAPDETTPIGNVRGGVQSLTTVDLGPGVYSFSAIAIDSAGVRSAPSNIASATVVAVADPLAAITDLTATVID